MKYAEWNNLNDEQKKNTHWRHHPRVRIATIFTVLFAIVFAVVLLRVFQNKRVHVNRNPNAAEAFSIAKVFVLDEVKQPASATFPKNKYTSNVDTLHNRYVIQSTIDAQDSSGKFKRTPWRVQLSYKGGDWADRKSWQLVNINIDSSDSVK